MKFNGPKARNGNSGSNSLPQQCIPILVNRNQPSYYRLVFFFFFFPHRLIWIISEQLAKLFHWLACVHTSDSHWDSNHVTVYGIP